MRSAWILAVLPVLALTGCSSTPEVPPPATDAARSTPEGAAAPASAEAARGLPDDFWVDVTILAAQDGSAAESRDARYIVFPDGTLHYAARPGRGPNTLPPIVRRLDHRQMVGLWNRARQLGLTEATAGDEVSNFRKVWEPWEGRVYLVAFNADSQYWNFTRLVEPGEQLDPALRAFIRDLAALAWAEDLDGPGRRFAPKRYDYGPDPYAAYRANAAELAEGADDEP